MVPSPAGHLVATTQDANKSNLWALFSNCGNRPRSTIGEKVPGARGLSCASAAERRTTPPNVAELPASHQLVHGDSQFNKLKRNGLRNLLVVNSRQMSKNRQSVQTLGI